MSRGVPLAVVLMVLAVSSCGSASTHPTTSKSTPSPTADSSTWWQINMSDGEVFYGHVRGTTASDIDLVNVYYLQSVSSSKVVGLVSNQIQCPTDEVIISRDAVTKKAPVPDGSQIISTLNTLALKPQLCFQPSSP